MMCHEKNGSTYSNIIGLDIVGTTIEVSDQKFISSSMLRTRKQFEELIEGMKKSLAETFYSMVEFSQVQFLGCDNNLKNKLKD